MMTDDFRATMVPNDTSFGFVKDANFLLFDEERGLKEVLGKNSVYEFMFKIDDGELMVCFVKDLGKG